MRNVSVNFVSTNGLEGGIQCNIVGGTGAVPPRIVLISKVVGGTVYYLELGRPDTFHHVWSKNFRCFGFFLNFDASKMGVLPDLPEGAGLREAPMTGDEQHEEFMAFANEAVQEADDILDELRIADAEKVAKEAEELLSGFQAAGRHLDPPSSNPEAARTAGEKKNENSVTDDNDDFDDPMSPEETRNEFVRFRAWDKFKSSFLKFTGFLTTYLISTS